MGAPLWWNFSRAAEARSVAERSRPRVPARDRSPEVTARPRRVAGDDCWRGQQPSPDVDVATFGAVAIATRAGRLVAVGVFVAGAQEEGGHVELAVGGMRGRGPA